MLIIDLFLQEGKQYDIGAAGDFMAEIPLDDIRKKKGGTTGIFEANLDNEPRSGNVAMIWHGFWFWFWETSKRTFAQS